MVKTYLSFFSKCRLSAVLFFVFFSLFPGSILFGQTTVPFTIAGASTWLCPAGVTSVTVECWGGGGAGGGATGNPAAGGGGAGGAYTKAIAISVTPGTTYNVFIGAGATGSTGAGASGGSSWFNTNTTLLAVGGTGGGLASSNSQTAAGAIAPSTGNIGGTINFYGGNGGTGGASGASGGGGGASAGTSSNGTNASGATGGTAVAGGGAGVNGSSSSGDGNDATTLGGGGAGGRAGSNTDRNGGNGFTGKVLISYTTPGTYKSQLVSMNLGSTTWCPGETRIVTVVIKNIGTASWGDAPGQDINVGLKWNTNGANWTDYYIRTDAGNITPGNQGTYNISITASNNIGAGYTTPLASGTNNLIFDVVYEGISWFGDNGGGVGPGNNKFTSANQTIATVNFGTLTNADQIFCSGGGDPANITFSSAPVGSTTYAYQWYYQDGLAACPSGTSTVGWTVIPGATGSSYDPPATTNSITYAVQVDPTGAPDCAGPTWSTNCRKITVLSPVNYGTLAPGDEEICSGGDPLLISLSTIPSGSTSFTYQWWYRDGLGACPTGTSTAGWTSIGGATTNSYDPPSGLNVSRTYALRVTPTGTPTCGTATWASNCRQITVNPLPTTVIVSGGGTFCVSTTINATNAGSGTIYFQGTTSNGTSTAIPSSSALITTSGTYYFRAQSAEGCWSVQGSATVTINSLPSITPAASAAAVCFSGSNQNTSLTYSSPTNSPNQYSIVWSTIPANTFVNITNATLPASPITIIVPANTAPGTYSGLLTVRNSTTGCVSNPGISFTVIVNALPALVTVSGGGNFCNGSTTLTADNGGDGTIYFQNTTSGGTSTTTPATSAVVAASGTYYFRARSASGCWGVQGSATVNELSTINFGTITNGAQTICFGDDPANITFSTAPSGGAGTFNYQWYYQDGIPNCPTGTSTSGWTIISGATGNSYDPPSGLTTSRTYAVQVDPTGTPDCGVATWATNCRKITVEPAINFGTIASGDQTICSGGDPSAITLSTPISGGSGTFSVRWYYQDGLGACPTGTSTSGWTLISGPVTSTYDPPSGLTVSRTYALLVDPTGTPDCGAATWATGCRQITVNPLPGITAASSAASLCLSSAVQTTSLIYTATTNSPTTYSISWSASPANSFANVTDVALSASPIIISVPANTAAGTYTGTITVKNANGCVSNGTNFTITVNALPTITTSATADDICFSSATQNVTLDYSATTNSPTSYSIIWNAAPANSFGAVTDAPLPASAINIFVPANTAAGTYTGTITVKNVNGCKSIGATFSVTVKDIPTGTLTAKETSGLANDDNIICANATVVFTATVGYPAYTFKVNGIIVQSGSANTYSSSTLTNGASVTVDLANALNCGATFGPVIISVKALPTGTLTSAETSGTANDNAICPGSNVTFTATTGFSNYAFKVNGSTVQNSSSNTFSTTTLSNGASVTVDVTDGFSCGATFGPQIITVNGIPSGNLTASSTTICSGDLISFTATAGFTNYNFRVNGITVLNGSSNTYSSTTLQNGQVVTVIVTNSTGCSVTFNPIPVSVNALPAGSITVTENSGTANDNTICAGTPVTFTFNSGYSNYNFKVNGVSKQNGSSNSYINTTLGNGDIVTVVVTTGSSCQATFTASSITIVSSPVGTLMVSPASVCSGDNVTFTATSGYTNYNFQVNGSTVQNGSLATFSSTTLVNGDIVTVDVTNSTSCTTTFNSITLTVYSLPTGILTASENSGNAPDDNTICTGATVTFTAPAGFSNYDFLLNGTTIQSGSSNVYTNSALSDGDNLKVAVTNANGCIALLNTIIITVNPLPSVQPITGTFNVCINSTTTLVNLTAGGTWSSLNPGMATIDAAGVVTGISAGTATINYSVINAEGCNTIVTANVLVNSLPVVSAITGILNVCVNNTTQLSDVTSGGIWSSSNSSVASISASGLVSGLLAGNSTISYTITNSNGCVTTVSMVITVNPLPILSSITGILNVCVNSTTSLFDVTTGGVWSSSDNAIATVNSSGVVFGVSPGISTISYTVTNSFNCVTIVTADVTINALPVPTLIGPNPICLGSVNNMYTTEPGQFNYVWNVVNGSVTSGGTGTDNTITVSWLTPGAKAISVNYMDANGCSGSASATVANAPGSSPVITGSASVCQNSINNVYTTQTGKIDYSWNINGGIITSGGTNTDNTATVTWNLVGSKSITVNYSDVNGCDAATPTVYNVSVNPQPTVIITNPIPVCSPATVNLTAASITSGSTPGLTYSYFTDAAATISYSTPSSAAAGTYYIKGTSSFGCFDVQPVIVTVNPSPTIIITNPGAVCSPATVDLTKASITAGSTVGLTFTYWTNAAATISYSTPTTATSGTYYIKGTTVLGCFDIQPAIVTVNPKPVVVVNNPTAVCSPAIVDLTLAAVTAGSTSGLTYTYFTDAAATLIYSTPATATSGTYYIKGTTGFGCYDVKPVIVTVNLSPTVIITNPTAICSPATVDLTQTAVTTGSTAGLTYTYWTNAAATISYPTPAAAGAGTYYIKGTTSLGCYNIQPVTVTVNPSPTVVITNPAAVCSPGTVDLTQASVTAGSTAGLTYSYYSDAAATISYSTPATAGAGTYYIKGVAASGCYNIKPVSVTINPKPTIVITDPTPVCSPATVNITLAGITAGSTPGLSYTYFTNAGATITYSTPTTATAGTYYIKGTSGTGCFDVKSVTVTVSAPPAVPTVAPATANLCQGDILPFYSGLSASTGNPTFSSGTINLTIPDNSTTGAATVIPVSGIPAGAIINSVSIQFYITHNNDGDLRLNLKAPNNSVLNLVDRRGGTGNNFGSTTTNTIISSNGTTNIIGQSAPFNTNNPYLPETAVIGTVGATTGGGNTVTTTSFANLFGTPNGNWTFSARDMTSGTTGSIVKWSITINYTIAAVPQPVTWSPATDLYTDNSATVAYTAGQSLATVYAKPVTSGTKVYTATATNAANCTSSTNITLTVSPVPVITIVADYCVVAGKVRLTASSIPAGATYVWSTTQSGPTIDVDIADIYYVVVTLGSCSGTASISVAQELVVNGHFTNGNTGFTSDYTYYPDIAGNNELVPDDGTNGYSVGTDGQNYHPYFFGQDHTNNSTGNKNYMIVNGHGNTLVVWKETVNVLPNTTYYFSAWAMSLNDAGPFAQLRFNVNGTLVGTTAVLSKGQTSGPINGWVRFYGTWTSGSSVTTADIQINDLQSSAPGNDFGLDDVSFGTLSTFIELESAPGTDAQTVCANTPITPIVYSVGSSSTGPTFTPSIPGLTTSFNGVLFTITGTPTIPGTYAYTVTTTGSCIPTSATGTITAQAQAITLSSATSSPTVCINAPVNITYSLSGTATGASVAGLPAGVTSSVSGTTLTINGSPTSATSSPYTYTITTSGTCTPVTTTGTITVQSQTIALNSASASQIICINSPLSNIQYTVGGTASNASVSGLPPGVTGSYNSGIYIISGTPTSAAGSPYTYTITTSGSCTPVTATGVITVTPGSAINLTSAPGTNAQNGCKGIAINAITYAVSDATGASVIGLPAGVTGVYNSGIFTISGTPTSAAGTFTYTITTSGGCADATISGTIIVQTQTINLTTGISSPSICLNAAMASIVYTIGGNATSATVSGLPAGITSSLSGNLFTISGTPTGPSGASTYTITTSGTCSQVTASGTITVQPSAIGGTLSSPAVCSGASGSLTVAGNVGIIQSWQYSIDGGISWTTIPNTTISQSYTNVTVPTLYRVVVGNNCGNVYSSVAAITIHNYWVGATSNNWNIASNWSDGALPSTSCPTVTIPQVPALNFYPVLNSGSATIINLQINANASLKITGATLQIGGMINNNGTFDVSNGTLEFNGTSGAQTIPAGAFAGNNIKDLIISNNVSLGGTDSLTGNLSFGLSGKTFITNDNLVLKSTAAGTANVGMITNGNSISGKVSVERYMQAKRAWRLLSVPTNTTQTFHEAWQENMPQSSTTQTSPAGYGTQITNALIPTPANGFDYYSNDGPSVKKYDLTATGIYAPYKSINTTFDNMTTKEGIFIFVRGDRRSAGLGATPYPTVLRTKGTLYTGTQPTINVPANQFVSVGNPYASVLDMNTIFTTNSTNLKEFFYLWDPNGTGPGNLGFGSFQTFFRTTDGNYHPTVLNGSYVSDPYKYIQSGQGFFMSSIINSAGSLTFTEQSKAAAPVSTPLVFRPTSGVIKEQLLRTRLIAVNTDATTDVVDGVVNIFGNQFNNSVDDLDAIKIANFSENIGIKNGDKILVVERRQNITLEDTIQLNMLKMKAKSYRFELIGENFSQPGLTAFLEDNYLNTRTPIDINGTSTYDFNVINVFGSYNPARFRIVFNTSFGGPLPVTFSSVKAYEKGRDIAIEWKVENELNIKNYEVEKSADGRQFNTAGVITAKGNVNYQWLDENPLTGANYYRIKSVDIDGKIKYSSVIKVVSTTLKPQIMVYPNPIVDGNVNLQLVNQPAGKYGVRLLNSIGQLIYIKQLQHGEGSSVEALQMKILAHGTYQLEITRPDNSKTSINILY